MYVYVRTEFCITSQLPDQHLCFFLLSVPPVSLVKPKLHEDRNYLLEGQPGSQLELLPGRSRSSALPKLPTRLAQSRRLRRWAVWCSLEAVVRLDVPGERTLEGGGDQDVKVRVSSSLTDHLGISPKRGLKYKMAGRVEPLVCRIPYWGCRALCCHCLCPLPRPPGLCGHGKDSSSLCLAFEGRYVHCKSPSIFWKLEGNSHHLKSFGS